jgi:small subunit ribosomal protein S6
VLQFNAPTSIIKELEIAYQRDERILRYLTVTLDKHALAYLVKRKERFGKKEPKKETAI